MRRFTTASITMLAGIVMVPACASIVGIDTDRQVGETNTTPTTNPTGTSTAPGTDASSSSSSSGNPPPDSGPDTDTSDECAGCIAGGFAMCKAGTKQCERICDGTTPCAAGTELKCPPGWQCTINCKNGCQGATCVGGTQCTFDCTTGNCGGAQCASTICRFECGQGNQCTNVECLGEANTTCIETCGSAGATKPCKDPIHCCTEGGKRQCPTDNSVCP